MNILFIIKSIYFWIFLFGCFGVLIATESLAQHTGFAVSGQGRGGAGDARQAAQISGLKNENNKANACTAAGLIYAPTHPAADSDGCTSEAAARDLSGNVTIEGLLQFGGSSNPCSPANEGALQYNAASKQIELCNGTDWIPNQSQLSLTYFSEHSPGGGASRYFECPENQFMVSCPPGVLVPSGASVCNNSINGDRTRCYYNGCGTISGQQWSNTAVCAGPSQIGGGSSSGGGSSGGGSLSSPPGMISAFNLATCPDGWSALNNAEGRVVIGVGSLGNDTYSLGETGGSARHTLILDEIPAHGHDVMDGSYDFQMADHSGEAGGPWGLGGRAANPASAAYSIADVTTDQSGGGQPHENRPPYLALLYCQKD